MYCKTDILLEKLLRRKQQIIYSSLLVSHVAYLVFILFCFVYYSSPYGTLLINVVSRALPPTNQQQDTNKEKDDIETSQTGSTNHETMATEELSLGDVRSTQDQLVSATNGQPRETMPQSKPQTVKHKFLNGAKKARSTGP